MKKIAQTVEIQLLNNLVCVFGKHIKYYWSVINNKNECYNIKYMGIKYEWNGQSPRNPCVRLRQPEEMMLLQPIKSHAVPRNYQPSRRGWKEFKNPLPRVYVCVCMRVGGLMISYLRVSTVKLRKLVERWRRCFTTRQTIQKIIIFIIFFVIYDFKK